MKKDQIKVGGLYTANVSGRRTTVRVDRIRERDGFKRTETVYDVTNLATGRKTTFRSAQRFRGPAGETPLDEARRKAKEVIRAAIRNRNGTTRPVYGTPTPDGALIDTAGSRHEPGTWFASKPSQGEEGEEGETPAPFASDEVEELAHPERTADRLLLEERSLGGRRRTKPTSTQQPAERKTAPTSAPATPTAPTAGTTALAGSTPSAYAPPAGPAAPSATPALSPLSRLLKASVAADRAPHLIVKAYAGTGKTFTEIIGTGWAFGQDRWPEIVEGIRQMIPADKRPARDAFQVVPSPEQRAVWEAMALSRGAVRTVTYCAFNKSIVTEFSEKWGWMVQLLQGCGVTLVFATVNSLGNSAVYRRFGRLDVKDWHSETIVSRLLDRDPRELKRDQKEAAVLSAVCDLVSYCKLTLAGWSEADGFDPASITAEELDQLASWYDIDLNGSRERVHELVPRVLAESLRPDDYGEMDFNDQNWLPVVLDLPADRADLLLIDEAQDLPRVRQEFARRIGKRLVVVGDVNQAIYGFAGADVDSIPRMAELLAEGGEVLELKLTETRRCSKAIVREAQRYVPDFRAHPDNPEGETPGEMTEDKYLDATADGDMVLCRVNAPLVGNALRLLKAGRKAVIRGREFGASLVKFVEKLAARDVTDLIDRLERWAEREAQQERAKRNPSEPKLILIEDKRQCILAFAAGAETVADVTAKIKMVFAGKECPRCRKQYDEKVAECWGCRCPTQTPKGVLFSSVHRAKGLEADNVFILGPELMPHPMARSAWARQQETHCQYIAVTRPKLRLTYVPLKKRDRDED